MTMSLGDALPDAIAKISELIGRKEVEAKEYDALIPKLGDSTRLLIAVIRHQRDAAMAAMKSGDLVAMVRAYEALKPALDLAPDLPESVPTTG